MDRVIPVVVLGASGYVGGELLRLLAGHPRLSLAAAVSESSAGEPIASTFPHLESAFNGYLFLSRRDLPRALEEAGDAVAVFSCANHGASAALVAEVLETAEAKGTLARVVDLSADFRYPTAEAYEAVYGGPHGAPALVPQFGCGLPEHVVETPTHVGHPGCFTTAVLLAIVPILKLSMVHPELYVSGVTGSTGAGREPKPTTHHPVRHSNLFAYQPLRHRHVPEMLGAAERASGVSPELHFVPHSGPFARGIYVTVQARLGTALSSEAIATELARFYEASPFVRVVSGAPKLKDVVGSNFAHLGVAVDDDTLVVLSAIDNLVKGAAGGAVQWMNRLFALDESTGLTLPGPGWI